MKKRRLHRTDWLEGALSALPDLVASKLTIEELCQKLGVSKGSFYAHFKCREDFLKQLAEYWEIEYTLDVVEAVELQTNLEPLDRISFLTQYLHDKKSAKHDVSVRALAAREPVVLSVVRNVDVIRYKLLESIFKELGFQGTELRVRTELYVVFYSLSDAFNFPRTRATVAQLATARNAVLTRD